jgi:hypothetical protein
MIDLDDRDATILAERIAMYDEIPGPRVGDFVTFADGVTRRISYIWRDEHDVPFSAQTSDGGSYHLGNGYVSMSGGLYAGVKPETLTLTDQQRDGRVWFFHHDHWTAHNDIHVTMPFRVFSCSAHAPR